MSTAKSYLIAPGYLVSWSQTGQRPASFNKDSRLIPENLESLVQWNHEAEQLPWQGQFCQLLGLKEQHGNRLPTFAMIEPVADKPDEFDDSSAWVHADPVHLKADRDTATLIPPELLNIDDQSANALMSTLNDFFVNDGIGFHRQVAGRWFISGQSAQSLAAYPTSFLAHRSASAFLPDDAAAGTWRRLMTEIQMILHTHPVNEERERRGLMTINSLWFWGGVPVTDTPTQSTGIRVFADDPFAVALCEQLQIERFSLSEATGAGSLSARNKDYDLDLIVVDTRLGDALLRSDADAVDSLTRHINDQLLQPLANLVLKGQLDELHVQTEDGVHGLLTTQSMKSLKRHAGVQRWWQHWTGKLT